MPSKLDPHIAAIEVWLAEQPQLTALEQAVSAFWQRDLPVTAAQQRIAQVLHNTDNRRPP